MEKSRYHYSIEASLFLPQNGLNGCFKSGLINFDNGLSFQGFIRNVAA